VLSDVIGILGSTPEKIRREIAVLSPLQLKARPAPDKWSIQEILAHLDDLEELGMRARVAAMIEQNEPSLAPFDQEQRANEQQYHKKAPLRSLHHFAHQRNANVKWLRTLKPAQLKRRFVIKRSWRSLPER
jgi:ribosomal protein L11 methylase PrmA